MAALSGKIPAATVVGLDDGTHTVYVSTEDSAGNAGPASQILLVVDTKGPGVTSTSVSPNPNNGTLPVNGSSPAVRVVATLEDAVSGTSGGTFGEVQSPIVKAEAFVDVKPGDPAPTYGKGVPMEVADGAFSGPTENVYLDIPLATVRLWSEGPHTVLVHGRDAAGNWGGTESVTITVDKTAPVLGALSVNPNPTRGAATVTVNGTIADDPSGFALMEIYLGTDPGVGHGTPVTRAADGSFSTAVSTAGLPDRGNTTAVLRVRDGAGNTRTRSTTFRVTGPLFLSTLGAVNPTGASGTARTTDVFFWDGTAAGRALRLNAAPYRVPSSARIDGFSSVSATRFYVSFSGNVRLPGLGTVQPRDVVLWTGSRWAMYFDGSVRGVGNTNIDAINVSGGKLYFSQSNGAALPRLAGAENASDIYRWNGGRSYTRAVDVSRIGLRDNANVDGFVWVNSKDMAFSVAATSTQVTGLGVVRDEDVIRRTNGIWQLYFDGSTHGLGAAAGDVNAFDLP